MLERFRQIMEKINSSPAGTIHAIEGIHDPAALASGFGLGLQQELCFRPQLVILPDRDALSRFVEVARVFRRDFAPVDLPSFDVSPHSGLSASTRLQAQRVGWCFRAQRARPDEIFVCDVAAVLQKTIPAQALFDQVIHLKKGSTWDAGTAKRLQSWGYSSSPLVEGFGQYSIRGGIVDIFSPAQDQPLRLELFGDQIESVRAFDPDTQRSLHALEEGHLIPCREITFENADRQEILTGLRRRDMREDHPVIHGLIHGNFSPGLEFLLPLFYAQPESPLDHFLESFDLWIVNSMDCEARAKTLLADLDKERSSSDGPFKSFLSREWYNDFVSLSQSKAVHQVDLGPIHIDDPSGGRAVLSYPTTSLEEFSTRCSRLTKDPEALTRWISEKIQDWKSSGNCLAFVGHSQNSLARLRLLLEKTEFSPLETQPEGWASIPLQQHKQKEVVHLLPSQLAAGFRLEPDRLVVISDWDIWGRRKVPSLARAVGSLESRAHALSFSDMNPGDFVVHLAHGVGLYRGLQVMPIQGAESEFIHLEYRDGDRLYLPVYRIGQLQKFSGPQSQHMLDKLGGGAWEKTKIKVKGELRDLAGELLRLYAVRSQIERPPYPTFNESDSLFSQGFPFEETEDQLKAIQDVFADFSGSRPMDRLICGDVGFGKTEVALRAAFKVAYSGRQVAIIAPTTVLTFQHGETFRRRFKDWPVHVRTLNRFVSSAEVKKTLAGLKDGSVDIVVGTHRLLSRDVEFKNLGLLIIDEEQKFGVTHKERIRKYRQSVDTLAMSATPIPRTLNLSLMGVRDLSLINTAPEDRLPTRTFLCRWEDSTVRKSIQTELRRGGQVFFIHNRIQSIVAVYERLKEIIPEARIHIAHGQMPENQLEEAMVKFFNRETDVLLCTTIIESGMDIPNANTMFIDEAQNFGLSQLYQLRGRVGRSKERAYCYLLVPRERSLDAQQQERLRIIQENVALGSGIRIAQHDLELRGAGDILGVDQSGHVNAVGYELYMELMEQALHELKGESVQDLDVDPEINVRIPALIPHQYISDIRIRLAYYKALSDVTCPEDLDRIEDELRDQFGAPPEPVTNLMGLMLIRKICRDLGVRDLSAGKSVISLAFTEATKMPPEIVVELSMMPNKKYAVTPDNRLNVRMNKIEWPRIIEELELLRSKIPVGIPRSH